MARSHKESMYIIMDSLSCGIKTAEYVSPSYCHHKIMFDKYIEKLRAIDSNFPKENRGN